MTVPTLQWSNPCTDPSGKLYVIVLFWTHYTLHYINTIQSNNHLTMSSSFSWMFYGQNLSKGGVDKDTITYTRTLPMPNLYKYNRSNLFKSIWSNDTNDETIGPKEIDRERYIMALRSVI